MFFSQMNKGQGICWRSLERWDFFVVSLNWSWTCFLRYWCSLISIVGLLLSVLLSLLLLLFFGVFFHVSQSWKHPESQWKSSGGVSWGSEDKVYKIIDTLSPRDEVYLSCLLIRFWCMSPESASSFCYLLWPSLHLWGMSWWRWVWYSLGS